MNVIIPCLIAAEHQREEPVKVVSLRHGVLVMFVPHKRYYWVETSIGFSVKVRTLGMLGSCLLVSMIHRTVARAWDMPVQATVS